MLVDGFSQRWSTWRWSTWAGLVFRGFFGLFGLLWSIGVSLVTYQSPVNNARATVLEDEVDDTIHYITLHYIILHYIHKQTRDHEDKQADKTNKHVNKHVSTNMRGRLEPKTNMSSLKLHTLSRN